jgi:glycosyltransferase involved in cell wall biosynthesis
MEHVLALCDARELGVVPTVRHPHLLMVVYAFPPLNHSGTIRSEAFAHYLPQHGVRTTVLTDQGNSDSRHPVGVAMMRSDDWADDEQPYEIRRMNWQLQPSTSRLARWLNRFPLASTCVRTAHRSQFLQRVRSVADKLVDWTGIDVIYGSGAPAEALLLAAELAERHRRPLVLDLRDPWSYQPPVCYRHYVDFLAERRVERRTLAAADAVLVATHTTAELLVRKLGLPRERVHVIPNGFDERDFAEQQEHRPPADRFVVTHAGQLSLRDEPARTLPGRLKPLLGFDHLPLKTNSQTRSPKYLLAAAAEFLRDTPEARDLLLIQLIGLKSAESSSAITDFPFPECLRVTDRVRSAEAVSACQKSHLLVVMQNRYFLDGEEFCVAIPAKLYTYLRTGRRILACLPESEIADIVRKTGAGITVRPDDVKQIRQALADEYHAWRDGGASQAKASCVDQYSRRVLAGSLAHVVRSVSRPPTQ